MTAAKSGGVGRKNDAKPAMVITANDLSKWENFPKGLKVLLLLHGGDSDGDGSSAAETRSKLESMDYIGKTLIFLSFSLKPLFPRLKIYINSLINN